MDCSNCGKSTMSSLQTCLICSKKICNRCSHSRICESCIMDYPVESKEIKKVIRLWGSIAYISIGIGILAILYWMVANILNKRLIVLDFWGVNTELYLMLVIFSISILVALGALILKKKIPVMIAELEKLKYGQTKSKYLKSKNQSTRVKLNTGVKPKNQDTSIKQKISTKLFSKEEFKPRSHNFMCCKQCSKLNKNTNDYCDECGSKLK